MFPTRFGVLFDLFQPPCIPRVRAVKVKDALEFRFEVAFGLCCEVSDNAVAFSVTRREAVILVVTYTERRREGSRSAISTKSRKAASMCSDS